MWVHSKSLTRGQLKNIPVPERANVGKVWRGIPHHQLADTMVEVSTKMGLRIKGERWMTNPSMTDLYGKLDFSKIPGLPNDKELAFSLGVMHSNVGRSSVRLLTGATVFVCSNGMVIADSILSRKHTTKINLQQQVEEGIRTYLDNVWKVPKQRDRLKNYDLRKRANVERKILIESASQHLISWSLLGQVYECYNNPPHVEFSERNAWSLYNAFTEVGKKMSAANNARLLRGLLWVFNTCISNPE